MEPSLPCAAMTSMYCLICGYDLSRTPGDACSECGTAFSRKDSSSWASSPSLLHRVLRHAPGMRERIIRQHTDPACRGCGARLDGIDGHRCIECNAFFDLDDTSSYLRAVRGIPRGVLRFQHVAPFRGIIAPLLLLFYGAICVLLLHAWLPALYRFRIGLMEIHGLPAAAIGVAAIGGAAALHARYFWGHVEPWWRHAPLGVFLGMAMMAAGLTAAVVLFIL